MKILKVSSRIQLSLTWLQLTCMKLDIFTLLYKQIKHIKDQIIDSQLLCLLYTPFILFGVFAAVKDYKLKSGFLNQQQHKLIM